MMQLFGSLVSPFVRHCRIALSQCRLEWEFVLADTSLQMRRSPVRKIPFLVHGDRMLVDSSSILKYVRESGGQAFFPDVDDFDLYCTANAVLDASINLFVLARDGLTPVRSRYLARQERRVGYGLAALNERLAEGGYEFSDGVIRLACYLDWAMYRKRIEISAYPNLEAVLRFAGRDPAFASTTPPGQVSEPV